MYSTLSTDCFPSQPRKEKGGFSSIISFAQQASYMAASAAAASESDER